MLHAVLMRLVEYCWFSLKSPSEYMLKKPWYSLGLLSYECAETEQRVWIGCKLNENAYRFRKYLSIIEIDSDYFGSWNLLSIRDLLWIFIHVGPAKNQLKSVVQISRIDAFRFIKWMFSGQSQKAMSSILDEDSFPGFSTPSLTSFSPLCSLWSFFFVWVTFLAFPTNPSER